MWLIFDYCEPDVTGRNPPKNDIAEWRRSQTLAQLAKLDFKLRAIQTDRDNERQGVPVVSPPPWMTGPLKGKYRNLYEIKVQGGKSGANIRMLACRGPQNKNDEVALLFGARELDNKWEPRNARDIALARYERISADSRWRCPHVWP
jgi:hypothetical protein